MTVCIALEHSLLRMIRDSYLEGKTTQKDKATHALPKQSQIFTWHMHKVPHFYNINIYKNNKIFVDMLRMQ